MTKKTLSSYGGSARQAADSRNAQKSLNHRGKWQARHEHGKVILSITAQPAPAPVLGGSAIAQGGSDD